jgi:long-chain acyl-CoA synthetase
MGVSEQMDACSLAEFFENTQRDDRGVSYLEHGKERWISYAELASESRELALAWNGYGIRKRFIALIWLEQSPDYLRNFQAVVYAGGIPVPVHAYTRMEEVMHIASRVEAEMVILSSDKAARLLNRQELFRKAVYIDGRTGKTLEELTGLHGSSTNVGRSYVPDERTSVIFMTSGSSGIPKGVMLSADNILHNVMSILDYVRLDADDRILLYKSLGYSSSVTGEWLLALASGAELLLVPPFIHPFSMISCIRDHRPTFLCTVPSTLTPLLKSSAWEARDVVSLRTLLIVGGAMPSAMLTALQQRIPHTAIMPSYGLTEASPRVCYLPADQLMHRPDSVGIPIQGVEVQIVRDGAKVSPGELGELVVRGPNVMLGYYNDVQRTGEVISEFGLHTSDIGCLDEDGFIYVKGRKDHALNIGGHTIYPEPVEQHLLLHPYIREAAVSSRSDDIWSQRMVALVVPADGAPPVEQLLQELHRYCQEGLSPIQLPREIHIAAHLPVTGPGKLDRRAVRQMVDRMDRNEVGKFV